MFYTYSILHLQYLQYFKLTVLQFNKVIIKTCAQQRFKEIPITGTEHILYLMSEVSYITTII